MDPTSRNPEVEAMLRLVGEGTATETGAQFFRTLVQNLAAALDMAGTWVTEYLVSQPGKFLN